MRRLVGILVLTVLALAWNVSTAGAASWNTYGGNAAHTREYTGHEFDGSLTLSYTKSTPGLMEFPPIYRDGTAYIATDAGHTQAFNADTGAVLWNHDIGGVAADSPTWSKGRIFVQSRGSGATGLSALSAGTGKLLWRHTGFTGESTPTAMGNWICGASTVGVIQCMGAYTGGVKWSYSAGCKITGSLARAGNYLYAADYCGHVYKFGRGGKLLWRAAVSGAVYANVAVRDGRVIVDTRDAGVVYALSTATGAKLWKTYVGTSLYASPAFTSTAVYTASRGGLLVRLNVVTGAITWHTTVSGLVMGSPVVIGGRVLYSVMGAHFTPGMILGYSLGGMKRALTFTVDGRYSPAVVAGNKLLLIGQVHIYGMEIG